jgi:hypothetical protein
LLPRAATLTGLAALLGSSCSLFYPGDQVQCSTDDDCAAHGFPANACVANICVASSAPLDSGARDARGDVAREAGRDATTDTGKDAKPDAGADTGHDTGTDATTDAGKDAGHDSGTDAGHDAGHDAPAPLTFACSIMDGSSRVVATLGADASAAGYEGLFLASVADQGVRIVTQIAGEQRYFVAYAPGDTATQTANLCGRASDGVVVLDVRTRTSAPESPVQVFTRYASPGGGTGLQVVTLPNSPQLPGAACATDAAVLATSLPGFDGARFVDLPGGALGYVVAVSSSPASTDLVVGVGPDASRPLFVGQGMIADLSSGAFFATGGHMYLVVGSALSVDGGVDGGLVVFGAADTLAEAGVAGWIVPLPFPDWTLISATAANPDGGVGLVALGGGSDGGFGFGGTVAASTFAPSGSEQGLTLESAAFTKTRITSNVDVQLWSSRSTATSANGNVVVVGGFMGGLGLLWLAPDGRVAANTVVPISAPHVLGYTAVQFDPAFTPESTQGALSGALFDVAWTAAGEAGRPSEILQATVLCAPVGDAG